MNYHYLVYIIEMSLGYDGLSSVVNFLCGLEDELDLAFIAVKISHDGLCQTQTQCRMSVMAAGMDAVLVG